MTYMVGEIIKEIQAGGPITKFPKSFDGPPKAEKEREALAQDKIRAKAAADNQAATLNQEPQVDWVKNKWARYYELNKMGHIKPNFDRMTFPQFEEYMEDALEQGRSNITAASTHLGLRDRPVQTQQKPPIKAASDQSQSKAVVSAAELQATVTCLESRPRKKPRVKAHITKEEYLKKH
ncbi:hypothetical protein OPT61_g4285 [Boeremia exigua]|uniref:Uncharacterized protein n=1 Tax=Boeremia exigua TaxID=749465 RepID=A0ACC2IEU8_9PLEO|nr:hypothetical protein OPT61_g4285 [Boeremia exigua]